MKKNKNDYFHPNRDFRSLRIAMNVITGVINSDYLGRYDFVQGFWGFSDPGVFSGTSDMPLCVSIAILGIWRVLIVGV